MLVNSNALLKKAQKGKYAVPHLNITGLESLKAIINVCEKRRSPVIIATSQGAIKYFGHSLVAELVQGVAKQASIPVVLHLDHGTDFSVIKNCIKLGYTSIMYDGSHLPFNENVRNTKRVVALCKGKGISVEAELGTLAGVEDDIIGKKIEYTDPLQAREFVRKTKCNSLAIAIGTSHGAYKFKGNNHIRIDILKEVKKQVKIPLVLHGASHVSSATLRTANKYGAKLTGAKGVKDSDVKLSIRNGICKVNVNTDLRLAMNAGVRKFLATRPKEYLPKHIYEAAIDFMEKAVNEKVTLFDSGRKC